MKTCKHCSKPFDPQGTRAEYCPKKKCQDEKMRIWEERKQKYNQEKTASFKDAKGKKATPSRRCIKGCGGRTRNYFGICDSCREKIVYAIT